jgi:hypothetical protein
MLVEGLLRSDYSPRQAVGAPETPIAPGGSATSGRDKGGSGYGIQHICTVAPVYDS